jgi:Arc/MetJ family transcription regulator
MRTTVLLDDELITKAKSFTGLKKTSQVLTKILDEYVRRESQLRLAQLRGTYKDSNITAPPRRRAL